MDDIMSSGGYAASQRYARELDERFNVSFKKEMQANELPVAALVSIENGCLVKHTMPEIYNPEKEILKEEREIEKYKIAVERKDRELAVLRAEENFVGVSSAAGYRREYQKNVDRATLRLAHLKNQAPSLIAQSIEQGKQYVELLKEEMVKGQQLIADAEKLKKEYEA
jgi:hypothetical protein